MTRERIEDMREVVLPFVKKRLLETNYEGLGEDDAKEFEREFNEILNLAIKGLEQEPTTKNDSSELEKNSKKLEKGTTKNDLGVDLVSRQAVIDLIQKSNADLQYYNENEQVCTDIRALPSVTPQLSVPEVTALAEWTEKLTKVSEDAYNKGYADGKKEQEPKTGEWIEHFDESGKWYECDQCHTDWGGAVNFCPDCGADMRGKK